MAFSDVDAAAELLKMSGQLSALSVQLAEMRGEFAAMRRDIERGHQERAATFSQLQQLQTAIQQPTTTRALLDGWNVLLLVTMAVLIVGAIFAAVYLGGQGGV